jgi:hypothetical protein
VKYAIATLWLALVAALCACQSTVNSSQAPPMTEGASRIHRLGGPPPSPFVQYLNPDPFETPLCAVDPCSSPSPDPNSSAMITQMFKDVLANAGLSGIQEIEPGTNGSGQADTFPVYVATSSDPTYQIHCAAPLVWGDCNVPTNLHIPNLAQASIDVDHHATVIESSSDTEYDFWQFNALPVSSSTCPTWSGSGPAPPGRTNPISGGGLLCVTSAAKCVIGAFADLGGCAGGSVASGVATQPILLDPIEIVDSVSGTAAVAIPHAIGVSVACPEPTADPPWPANRDDGYPNCGSNDLAGGPHEGEYIWLALTDSQIDSMSLYQWEKVILLTMHHWGLFISDTNGDYCTPWAFYGSDDKTYSYNNERGSAWGQFFNLASSEMGTNYDPGFSDNASHMPLPMPGPYLNTLAKIKTHLQIVTLPGDESDSGRARSRAFQRRFHHRTMHNCYPS